MRKVKDLNNSKRRGQLPELPKMSELQPLFDQLDEAQQKSGEELLNADEVLAEKGRRRGARSYSTNQ